MEALFLEGKVSGAYEEMREPEDSLSLVLLNVML